MGILAERLLNTKPSPTVAITTIANELKAAGRDIISLAPGEPDFDTPRNILDAGKRAMDEGKTRYASPAGLPELRQAICDKLQRENGLDYTPDQIAVSSGGKQSIFNAFAATLDEGDEVIVPAPYWVSYPDITTMFEGVPVFIDCPAEAGFKLTPEQLRAAITPKTKWLVLNSPSNPTGACYSREELQALADVLLEPEHQHVWIMTDDIYEHIIYDDVKVDAIAQVAPQLKERALIINGFAKAYCMTGWRLGYAAGPKQLIKGMNTIQSQSATSTTTFVQWAGIEALNGTQVFIAEHNETFKARRDLVVRMLNEIDGIDFPAPNGAFYVYPSCAAFIGKQTPAGKVIETDEDFVTYLLENTGVACVHGAAFGLSPHFRISYATSTELLTDACNRIKQACQQLS